MLGPFSPHPCPLPQGENSPSKHAHCAPEPNSGRRVCPERAASILHPQPGALGTDAPYLEVHGEGESWAAPLSELRGNENHRPRGRGAQFTYWISGRFVREGLSARDFLD